MVENTGFEKNIVFAIHIHAGGDTNTDGKWAWSEGCQIIYYTDYVEFGKKVGFLSSNTTPITGPSTTEMVLCVGIQNAIGVSAYYTLDRTFMPNRYYGTFFGSNKYNTLRY